MYRRKRHFLRRQLFEQCESRLCLSTIGFASHDIECCSAGGASSVTTGDLDGDGDLDVLSASFVDGRIAWHEQRVLGDANDDGVFDSSDLVRVFQFGEFEDGIVLNSTFDEGDWNGDGEFNSSDLVRAFQAGHYESGGNPLQSQIGATVADIIFAEDNGRRPSAYIA